MVCLLIMSCQRDQHNGVNDACRDTFLAQWSPLHFFFIGGPADQVGLNEAILPCPDDYGALQLKQRAAYRWALDAGVYHAFVSFTDTYIHVPRLLSCGFDKHDYFGLQVKHGGNHLSGGNGYWLSRRAMEAILKRPNEPDMQGDEADWLAISLAGMKTVTDDRFGTTITRHLSKDTGVYNPAWMYETHKEMTRE